jgi:hypothetical protein
MIRKRNRSEVCRLHGASVGRVHRQASRFGRRWAHAPENVLLGFPFLAISGDVLPVPNLHANLAATSDVFRIANNFIDTGLGTGIGFAAFLYSGQNTHSNPRSGRGLTKTPARPTAWLSTLPTTLRSVASNFRSISWAQTPRWEPSLRPYLPYLQ